MALLSHKNVRVFSDIIHLAHTDVNSPAAWSEILDLVPNLVSSDNIAVVFYDTETSKPAKSVLHGVDPQAFKSYEEYYHARDPFVFKGISTGNRVFRPTDILTRRAYEKSEFFNDFTPLAGCPQFLMTLVGYGEGLYAHVVLGRTDYRKPFHRSDMKIMSMLQSHFTRAFREAEDVSRMEKVMNALRTGFQQFERPIFMFDDDGKLVHMNQCAEKICGGPIALQDHLINEIQSVSAELIRRKKAGLMDPAYPRGMKCDLGGQTYWLETSPICLSGKECQWTVVAVDISSHMQRALHLAMNSFGLSPRECEICTMLVEGKTNREIADALYITEFTVKDHIKNIFEKFSITCRSQVAPKLLGF